MKNERLTEEILTSYQEKIFSSPFREKFNYFYELLVKYNKMFNLTSIIEEKEVFSKHFLDSAVGEFLFPLNAKGIEIGSGAGFPSLPLKILREDISFTLVESTAKKCEFLKTVVDKLSLHGVKVVCARAEDLAKEENFREQFDFCTARAVAQMNTLSEYCLPFVKVGGKFVAYKGEVEEELKNAHRAITLLGGKEKSVYSYELFSYGHRSLVEVEKISSTPQKYPRGNGKERKNPL